MSAPQVWYTVDSNGGRASSSYSSPLMAAIIADYQTQKARLQLGLDWEYRVVASTSGRLWWTTSDELHREEYRRAVTFLEYYRDGREQVPTLSSPDTTR